MATSYRAFLIELYQEYLSEASFLYERQRNSFSKPESMWTDVAGFERRLEAHIDGLVVGDELALEVCRQKATEGDFGELYAALGVFCRHQRKDIVKEVLDHLDPDDVDKWRAAGDALKRESPAGWRDEIVAALEAGGPPNKLKSLAHICGWRRWDATAGLSEILDQGSSSVRPDVLWAFGRLKAPARATELFKFLEHQDEAICYATAVALLRRGEPETVTHLLGKVDRQAWGYLPVALSGGKSAYQALLRKAQAGQPTPDLLVAMGFLGVPSAVSYLIYQLGDTALAPAAALALQMITAANLLEEVFVPDVVDGDELFEHEKERLKQGAPAVRPDGKLFGTNVRQFSLDPVKWKKWWSAKTSQYSPGLCYRHGEPFCPERAVKSLDSEQTPNRIRQLMIEELAIRYGCDVPLESDMSVVEQKQALRKVREWANAHRSRFQPGAWYFDGTRIT